MCASLLKVVAATLCFSITSVLAVAEDAVTFNRDVRPIFANKCFACHGPSEEDRKKKLRLDLPDGDEGALTPRKNTNVISPGKPDDSELWFKVTAEDEKDRMPPKDAHKEPLTSEERAVIKRWILDGAEYQSFWSFLAPEKSAAAKIENEKWGEGSIDNRVLARLEREGLQPKDEADKRTLLRRVTFDLTGLPPTLEEIDTFINDESPQAYAGVIDDLLDRESYGEHMARYWADLVRLADTNGMHKDFNRDFTTYRDWIIRSFNANLPFDEFVKYQLAGDLYEEPSRDQLVASGFNRLHLIIDRGTALPEESLHKNVLDRVEAFGTTFLGMTVQCAQCHDHKYDPISQKDFYQFYAFFNNFSGEPETTRAPERGFQPPFIHLTTPEQDRQLAEYKADVESLSAERSSIQNDLKQSEKWPKQLEKVSVPWIWVDAEEKSNKAEFETTLQLGATPDKAFVRFVGISRADVSINGTPLGRSYALDRGISSEVSEILTPGENVITAEAAGKAGFAFILEYEVGGEAKTFTSSANWQARANDEASWNTAVEVHDPNHENAWTQKTRSESVASLTREIEKLGRDEKKLLRGVPGAMVMSEKVPPRPATMLVRGAYDAPGDAVERNTPDFLPPMKEKDEAYSRMDLAEWLVDPNHPLTARVAVNRVWQQFFGVGLVKTSEDFGAQGEWPSHPALLDDIARDFVDSGWDVKKLVRSIVLSNTYRQRSDAEPDEFRSDPENRLLARGSRYRMDAEMIRDQILAVSGQLNRTMYGRSVKPPQPPGLWKMVSMAEPSTYIADEDDSIYRRSLYTYWRRGMPPPQMTVMNAPSREFCVARRERTNTPLQALLLMNEQEYFKAAKACAASALDLDLSIDDRLSLIYEKITSHEPEPDRLNLMNETLIAFTDLYKNDRALTDSLTSDLSESESDDRVELAAWTMLTHSLLNLELAKIRR